MNRNFAVDLAIDYTDEDVEFIKQQRKYFARKEQTVTDKTTRKVCQRYVKATTFVVNELMREPGEKEVLFPSELETLIKAVFVFTTSTPRIEFSSIYESKK